MCANEDGAIVCECLEGFVADVDSSTSCVATAAPTTEPTAPPTTESTTGATSDATPEPEPEDKNLQVILAPAVQNGGHGYSVGGQVTMGAGVKGWTTPATLGE
jgi:hypothetical protein